MAGAVSHGVQEPPLTLRIPDCHHARGDGDEERGDLVVGAQGGEHHIQVVLLVQRVARWGAAVLGHSRQPDLCKVSTDQVATSVVAEPCGHDVEREESGVVIQKVILRL